MTHAKPKQDIVSLQRSVPQDFPARSSLGFYPLGPPAVDDVPIHLDFCLAPGLSSLQPCLIRVDSRLPNLRIPPTLHSVLPTTHVRSRTAPPFPSSVARPA